jgi:hypothetical protein
LEQGFVQFQGRFLEPLVKKVLVAKLKLRYERVLIRSLVTLKLLAGEEVDLPLPRLRFLPSQWVIEPLKDLKALVGWGSSSLAKLVFLSEQGVIESLMKMRSLLEQMAQPLVDLHVERQGHPQVDLPLFLLQISD